MDFTFLDNPRRDNTPLLVGLVGPSGCGKTLSAIRLATGIKAVRGGKIVGLDTEARRMLHYADDYPIDSYLPFGPPFSSERYTEALKAAAARAKGGVVIVDSMSHEHEGEGGYLEFHEAELDRIAGNDARKRLSMNFNGWIKPAQMRRRLINTILQLECSFLFCFRAKEKLQIITGKNPIPLGYQAIGGEEFAFEMTVRCLLQPGCEGVPDWTPDAFRLGVPKRSYQHTTLVPDGRQLDEGIGEALALWAKGSEAGSSPGPLYQDAESAARRGNRALDLFLKGRSKADKTALKPHGAELRRLAERADSVSSPEDERQSPPVEPEDESQLAAVGVASGEDEGSDADIDMDYPEEPGSAG